ncbi:MAG TPA: hypothetical protein PKH93_02415, partial [Chitinophagales bacterium]|nr:hypothetical protein [Chitinophagales bacterium]
WYTLLSRMEFLDIFFSCRVFASSSLNLFLLFWSPLAVVLVLNLLIFLFLYGNIFWAIALGWYFESYLIGFAAFTVGYFLLIILLLLLWSPLRRFIRNRFVGALVDNDFSSPKKP